MRLLLIGILFCCFELNAQDSETYFNKGKETYSNEQYDVSIKLFSKAIELSPKSGYYSYRATAFEKLKDSNNALLDYSKAIKLDSSIAYNFTQRGRIYFGQNEFEKAKFDLTKADSIESLKPKEKYLKGLLNYRLGNLIQAKMDFKSINEDFKNSYNYYNYLGLIHLDLNEPQNSLTYFDQAILIDENNPSAFNNKAAALNLIDNYSDAKVSAERAIELSPNMCSAYNHRAFANLYLGNMDLAQTDVSKSIALDSSYSKSYYTLGLIAEGLNNLETAKNNFIKSMSLTPGYLVFYQFPYLALKRVEQAINNQKPVEIILDPLTFKVNDKGEYVTSNDSINISGKIIGSSQQIDLTHKDENIKLKDDQSFTHKVPLNRGINQIDFHANDGSTRSSSLIINQIEKVESKSKFNEKGHNYALIIGVNEYESTQIGNLNKPIEDAKLLKKTLVNGYNFEDRYVKILENPNRAKIYKLLDNFSSILSEDDNLIIFYAGHGSWDEKLGKGYWLLSDAIPNSRSTWFSNSDLKDYISVINCNDILLIADACFSGGIFKTRSAFSSAPSSIQELQLLKSRRAITSGDLKKVPDESVFIKYLISTLEQNDEKYITSEDIFYKLKRPVIDNTNNIPQSGSIKNTGGEGGDFIFIKKN